MLDRFRQRLRSDGVATSNIEIVQADAEMTWPAADRAVRVAFGSRVLHLLSPEHVVRETLRIASPQGVTLLIGRVGRDGESVRSRMRERMRTFLAAEGIEGKSNTQVARHLIERCVGQGGTLIGPSRVARWRVSRSPEQSIDSWANKPGVAGIEVAEEIKRRVLARLRAWAEQEFGDLSHAIASDEEYIVEGVRLRPED
jgi:hypothetical protein